MKKTNFMMIAIACIASISNLKAENANYISNRAPLVDVPFTALPLGSVKAEGWLLKQLELQKDGLTGNAETLYSEANNLGPNSDWLGGPGNSWERVPYYVKGLVPLAYSLNDATLISKAQKWINWSLNSQKTNGFFGPVGNTDWWARMPMLYAIRDFYEATNDARVIPFFTKYFQYQLTALDAAPLKEWGKARAGDNIEIVLWTYNQTGDAFLLTLADKLKAQAYDWTDIFTNNKFFHFQGEFYPKHNVNVPQAIKMPMIYFQRSNSQADKDAFVLGRENLMHDHGQPYGMESGNEMICGKSSISGVEMCSIVEQMQSCETAQMISGDVTIGDQLEKVAFNALPGGVSKDFKGLQYYTQANQVKSVNGDHGFGQEYNNAMMPGPYSGYPCCRYNFHMGWPYYVKSMWAATNDNGLAAMAYGPANVTAKVADGKEISIREETNYPFADTLTFIVNTTENVTFPLKLRIPSWCQSPVIKVNGIAQESVTSGSFYTINRIWSNNDKVQMQFPMNLVINDEMNNAVSVQRGPLVYSLKILENWVQKNSFVNGFKEFEVQPTSSWNYALVVDKLNPLANIQVNTAAMPENPFVQSTTPVTLTADAKILSTWGLVHNGVMANDPDYGPVQSTSETQKITLVPFGAENIRVTTFPVIGTANKITTSFQDDFSSGTQTGWINYGGSFYVNNGEYIATNPEGRPESKSIQTATSFTDFTYDVRVQVGASGNAGIIFRVGKTEFIPDGYNGYYFGISAGSSKQLELGKANGGWTSLKTADFNITANTWYQVRVVAQGTNIKIYVNDMTTPKINYTDVSFSSGSIGVRNYNAVSKWDDISVTDLSVSAVQEIKTTDKIKISPNPAKDFIDILFVDESPKDCKINIFNASGCLLKSLNKNERVANVRIDTKGMCAGIYILKIAFNTDNYNSKFIIL